MDTFGKIAFGVRAGRVDPVFFASWTNFLASGKLRVGDAVLTPAIELPHHWAADVLVRQFLNETDCDSLMMFDDDMGFSTENVLTLRNNKANHDFDVVQGLCVSRKNPSSPIVLIEAADHCYQPAVPDADEDTCEVAMCGLAFTIIRRKVFEQIAEPGKLFFSWGDDGRGEDATFCENARAAGFTIGIDCKTRVAHQCNIGATYDPAQGKTHFATYDNRTFKALLKDLGEVKTRKRKGEHHGC